ncbi:hypothetical protein HanXRQr2_Chr12g0529631 [Helianthus annuus]|uniref:Uncharacterized protein n=1 Tax=Helianthus annuus TaxID=4232 RepID=A0A9K3HEN6_HELAN|nr:hypothetical protein HanXRQr2_Chr12g0529631 [Helianthus annuus]KAJ0861761.1 hypothetical protein HanPSC8_Chr12g0510291 [Helianthus annuus]
MVLLAEMELGCRVHCRIRMFVVKCCQAVFQDFIHIIVSGSVLYPKTDIPD